MQGKKRQWLTGVAAGTIMIAMGARASAGTSTINVTGTVIGGVNAQFSGTTSIVVNVTKTGSVTNTSAPAIIAGAQQGSATVVDNGVVSATGGDGIDATNGSGAGVANITINKSLTATGNDGARAQNDGTGLATITIGSGTTANPLVINGPLLVDAVAASIGGVAQVTAGNHDTFIAGAPGEVSVGDLSAIGVLTMTNAGGPISVTVGTNDSFTLQGDNSAAITAHTGVPGLGPNGTASAVVTVGNGVAIHASGYSDAGVIAFVADPSGANAYAGTGNASVLVGSGSITVDEVGAAGNLTGSMTNAGVAALSAGGAVSIDNAAVVTVTGGLDASVGLGTKTSGAGTSLITSRANVTSNNGDGIKAVTAGGANTVNVVGGNIVATGGDGIDAVASGGAITITTASNTDVKTTTPGAASGILASDTTGNISIITKGTVSNGGISATTGGSGSITVQATGAVTDINGAGISATAANGPVSITTGGPVTATGNGVFGESTGAGGVAITIGQGGVQTTGVAAVEALDLQGGPGAASVTTLNGTTKAPLAISGATVGVEAVTVVGPAAVNIGNQNSFTVGASGATKVAGAVALDLFAPSDILGVPSAKVTVGTNDSFTVQGNNGAAISAQIGQAGAGGPSGGSGSVAATVGNGIAIHVSGLSDAGVIGFVSDPSGANLYAGTGNVSVTVGTGSIVVDEVGASGPLTGAGINVGVAALSSGGNVMVDDAATVTASGGLDVSRGLSAITSGVGTSLVNARASVTSLNGDGIFSSTQNGQNTVNQFGGNISATNGDGIDAVASGVGAIAITTAAGTSVGTTTPGAFSGILAKSAGAGITINAAGAVTDGGISATTTNGGGITISAAQVTDTAGNGVTAIGGAGAVSVTTTGVVTASGGGVFAQNSGGAGPVTVAIGKSVFASATHGAEAFAGGSGTALVTTASGASKGNPLKITAAGNGLLAVSVVGKAGVQVGDNNSVTVGSPGLAVGGDVVAIALLKPSDTGGAAASVTTGVNDVLTFQGNGGAGISAQVGLSGGVTGVPGLPNGTASSLINVGNGVAVNVSGLNDAGVIGFVTDISGKNAYATKGAVSVTVGTGAINVNETGAVGTAGGSQTNVGVGAFSAGGNVSIDDAAVVTASGGQDASIGLEAVTTGAGASAVTSRANITSANGDGIRSATASGANQVTVLSGKVSGSVYGVEAISTGTAAVTINTAAGTDVRTTTPAVGNFGILGQSSGTVTINAAGTVSEGGISATGGGDAIVNQAGAVTSTTADGIDVTSFGGAADIFSTARINAAGDGVLADGFTALVSASAPITAGADFADIDAIGNASASIVTANGTSAARLVFKSGGTGIAGTAFGDPGAVQIQIGDFNTVTAGGNTQTSNDGVLAESLGVTDNGPFASANIVLGASDTVTVKGNDAGGVVAINASFSGTAGAAVATGDGVNVHVSGFDVQGVAADTTFPALAALIGQPLPGGNASVSVGAGTVTVDESGATGLSNGNFGNENVGVAALSGGGGDATLDDSAVVNASGGADFSVGLQAETTGSGAVLVNARANVTSHQGDGIEAFAGSGSNTVNVYAAVSATTIGVAAGGSGAITINVAPGGSISGHAVGIKAASTAGPVTVNNAGTITSSTGPGVALVSGGAITLDNASSGIIGGASASSALIVTGGGVVSIDNAGQIGTNISNLSLSSVGSGPLTLANELSGLFEGRFTGGDNVTFNNAGTWQTRGVSDFGTAANAATNTLNNVGTVVVGFTGPATSASSASFLDLGTFNNGSATGTGTVTMANGKVGDKLTVSGLFNGVAGHSNLNLDAFLGGPGSHADQLILQGGSAGQTLITINDTNTGDGALNSKGIVLVTGATSGATFALNPTTPGYDASQGGIVKGLFLYPLVFNAGTEELVGLPGAPAMEMATMASAAEQVWSATTPGDESAAGLRLSLASGGDPGPDGPHLWAKAVNGGPSRLNRGDTLMGRASFSADPGAGSGDVGAPMVGTMQQTQTETAFGVTYGFNTGYSQNVSALLTGVDLAHHVGQNEAWSWGISSGYLESQQSFTAGAALASYSGALAAVHGAYVNTNGFYVAGDAKLTALQVDYATNWAGAGHPTTSITTFGGEADAGWRRSLSAHWTLEPSASISMQSSKLGSLNVDGTDVRFGDASSVRLGFGGKLDGSWHILGYSLKSESSLRVWDELEGANTLLLGGSGDGFTLPDQIGGVFTDAAQSLSLESADGLRAAFISGAYRWKEGYEAAQLSAGFKLRW